MSLRLHQHDSFGWKEKPQDSGDVLFPTVAAHPPLFSSLVPGLIPRSHLLDGGIGTRRTFNIMDILPELGRNFTEVKFMKLSEYARLPTTHGPGLKLYSAHGYAIRPWEHGIVRTDLIMKLDDDVHAEVRSLHPGQQAPRDFEVFPAALPTSYFGTLLVSVHNLTDHEVVISRHGDVASLTLQTTRRPVVAEMPYCSF